MAGEKRAPEVTQQLKKEGKKEKRETLERKAKRKKQKQVEVERRRRRVEMTWKYEDKTRVMATIN